MPHGAHQKILYEMTWLASSPATTAGGSSGKRPIQRPPSGYPLQLQCSNPLAAGLAALQTFSRALAPSPMLDLTSPDVSTADALPGARLVMQAGNRASGRSTATSSQGPSFEALARAAAAGLWAMMRSAGAEMLSVRMGGVLQASTMPLRCGHPLQQQPLQLQVGTHSAPGSRQPGGQYSDGGFGIRVAAGYEQHPRLLPRAAALQPLQGPFRLEPQSRGALTSLTLVPHPTLNQPQGAAGAIHVPIGCIVMEVRAVGVNFRDVLNILGMYPGNAGLPGSDCSGSVTQVGPGVGTLQVGDDVMGLAEGSLGSHVVASAATVVKMPAHVSHVEAASLPTVCITADAALRQVGPYL